MERHRAPGLTRRGSTLLELLVVVLLAGILAGLALPRAAGTADRRAVRAAVRDVALLLAAARQIAATGADGAAVAFDTAAAALRLTSGGSPVRTLGLGAVYGVRLQVNRDSLAYDARGLGVGAANVTLIVSRSTAAESLFVSRLGRVRGGQEW